MSHIVEFIAKFIGAESSRVIAKELGMRRRRGTEETHGRVPFPPHSTLTGGCLCRQGSCLSSNQAESGYRTAGGSSAFLQHQWDTWEHTRGSEKTL